MAFKKAERTKLWARVAIFGPSGSGKSYTALRIAKGLAQRAGTRIAAIDTENRSLSKYADRFDFDVDDLGDKTIDTYIESIKQCIKDGYKVLVIDSLTHCWKELLEEIDRIASKSFGGNSWAAWSKGTPKQNKLIKTIVEFPGHLIVTMRSKTEWSLGKNEDGKNTVARNGMSPEQGKGIEYEFDILMDINQGHIAEIQKDRTGKFQDKMIEKPGEEFGEALYDWLNSGNAPPPPPPTTLRQECIDGMLELKNIMLATTDDGTRLFTDDEYNNIKKTLNDDAKKPDDERLTMINNLLNAHKEQLQLRFDNWCKTKHPGPENVPPVPDKPKPSKPKAEKPSLKEEYEKIAQNSSSEKPNTSSNSSVTVTEPEADAQAELENDSFVDDIPGETETADAGELDIF
jgi:hypothetical protein